MLLYTLFALGVGFVGRHLTSFLINQKLASKVRVVDKVPPATGWLNAEHSVSQTATTKLDQFNS